MTTSGETRRDDIPLPSAGESDLILLRLPQVRRAVGNLSRATIYRSVKNGSFPAPLKIGLRATAWRWGDIRAWLEQKAAAPTI
jgi:prophage regulatory protein